MLQAEDLKNFEEDIANLYESGQIKAPVHLRDGNEEILVKLFSELEIGDGDYVFSTWASHLHALLKGIPPKQIRHDILEGRSITLHYPEHNFFSSAIVGGISPIAIGTAIGIGIRIGIVTGVGLGICIFIVITSQQLHTALNYGYT